VEAVVNVVDLVSFGNSPWVGRAGLIGTVIAIILAVYFYQKSRRFKRPAYAVTTKNLILDYSSKLRDLQILFKGKDVRNLSVSKIAIWNDGTETIRNSDIADADPLQISSDAEFLDSTIVFTTSPAIQFGVQPRGNILRVGFDFLDKNQGGIIQVVHTGSSSEKILLTGSVKGALPTVRRTFESTEGLTQVQYALPIGFGLIGLIGALATIVGFLGVSVPAIDYSVFGLVTLAFVLFGYLTLRSPVPKQFESIKQIV
jgi:hypothetical protein